jgi:hypothetical protein
VECGGKSCYVGGTQGVSIASGAGKRRKIAICGDHLGKHLSGAVEQFCQFLAARAELRGVFLHGVAGSFKA